jgi:hypothetical protein
VGQVSLAAARVGEVVAKLVQAARVSAATTKERMLLLLVIRVFFIYYFYYFIIIPYVHLYANL